MLSIIKKTVGAAIILAALPLLSSFTEGAGGEGFEIYINNKLVLQRFNSQVKEVKAIQLDPSFASYQLTVKYFHCGTIGKNRNISVRNNQNQVLKQWKFADGKTPNPEMSCNVKDILNLKKSSNKVNFYYSSSELPEGRLLAALVLSDAAVAKR